MASPAGRKILFIIGSLQIGGTERHIAAVAPELAKAGWHVSIYTLASSGVLADELRRQGVNIVGTPIRRGQGNSSLPLRIVGLFVTTMHLFFYCVSRRPDIVHYFLPASYLIGAPVAMAAGLPQRVMSRRSLNLYQKKRPLLGRLERLLHPYMKRIIGNSQRVVDQLRNEEHVASQKLRLIYNGLDLALFSRDLDRSGTRKALGLAPDTLVLVVLANLIPYKGHTDLIDALALARSEMPDDWRLLAVGRDDGIQGVLEERAKQLGLAEKVVFVGQRSDVANVLLAADIGLLCSHEEGFSNAILEKMAAGLPMIVTDVGGNSEAVIDGVTGLVVPARDPPKLADAIVRLTNDGALRSKFGAAGRQRVVECFSLERCVSAYDAMYRELLGMAAPASGARAVPELGDSGEDSQVI